MNNSSMSNILFYVDMVGVGRIGALMHKSVKAVAVDNYSAIGWYGDGLIVVNAEGKIQQMFGATDVELLNKTLKGLEVDRIQYDPYLDWNNDIVMCNRNHDYNIIKHMTSHSISNESVASCADCSSSGERCNDCSIYYELELIDSGEVIDTLNLPSKIAMIGEVQKWMGIGYLGIKGFQSVAKEELEVK